MTDFSLENKVALITGASRGIGEAIALNLAEHGANCILASRKIEALDKVVRKIEDRGGKAEAIACHVGHPEAIISLFEKIGSRYEKLDILINNAAANPHFGEMIQADEGVWEKIMEVNLKGPFFMVKQAVPLMEAAGSGAIVNVSSINGVRPGFWQGLYSISKAALISMTHAYARELASKNIRVNALLPGLTNTKFASALIDNKDIHNKVVSQIPMGRHAEPCEMAGAVLYLVSEAASYTTGICLVCDGGLLTTAGI